MSWILIVLSTFLLLRLFRLLGLHDFLYDLTGVSGIVANIIILIAIIIVIAIIRFIYFVFIKAFIEVLHKKQLAEEFVNKYNKEIM